MGFLQSTWELIRSTCQYILDAVFRRRMDWQERYNDLVSGDNFSDDSPGQDNGGFEDSQEKGQETETSYDYTIHTGNPDVATPMGWQEKLRKLGFSATPRYFPEETDIHLRKKCDDYLRDKFPNGFEYFYYVSTLEERVEMVKSMAEELSVVYGVNLYQVNLYTPDPGSNLRTVGYYDPMDNSINMNVSYLFRCDIGSTAEVFAGLLHELKHARQWAAIQGWQDYGYSAELLYEWALNWKPGNYIDPDESDEGYRTQPLEFDAYAFGNLFTYLFFPQR